MLLKVAWRSIWRNKRRTIITLTSIVFSLTIAIFFIAMSDGMYDKLTDEAVRMQAGHLTVEHKEYRDAPAIDLVLEGTEELSKSLSRLEGVERIKALVSGQGVAKSGSGSIGVVVLGVDAKAERDQTPLAKKMVAGEYLTDDDEAKVIIGSLLAKRLKLKVGKKMVVSSNSVGGHLVEELVRVRGIFETGATEVDGFFIQIPLGFARKLYGMKPNQATQLGIILTADADWDLVMEEAPKLLAKGQALRTWQEVMPDLAAFMAVDKGSNYVFQGIIMFLILFTIFNTILMSVLERSREFAVLLAIGTSVARIKAQVFVESALIGLVGALLGVAAGGGLTWYFNVQGLDVSAMMEEGMAVSGFSIDTVLRPAVDPAMMLLLGGAIFGATMIMSLFPMGRIKRIPVADVLR